MLGLELRVFLPGGPEHRGALRAELLGPEGARHGVAFATPPYRVLGLEPGDWRVAVVGPVLAGCAAAARLTTAQVERVNITYAAPTLEELAWPLPPQAPTEFTDELEHLQATASQTPVPSAALPAADFPASR